MANNYLHSDAPPDLAEELLSRAGRTLSGGTRDRLVRVIERHLRTSDVQTAPVRKLPPELPAWAIRAQEEGAILHHCLPTPRLHRQVREVAKAIEAADKALSSHRMRATSPALRENLERLVIGIAHWEWEPLHARCLELGSQLNRWRAAQRRYGKSQIVRLPGGRRWRRLCSVQELWDASAGTDWCVREGGICELEYAEALQQREVDFWVLEAGIDPLVLATVDDRISDFVEVKDRANLPPVNYRGSVRYLASKLGISTDESYSEDIKALALDGDLGRVTQTYWIGDVEDRRARYPLRFRLWADGRRRKYLVRVAEPGRKGSTHYLRLRRSATGEPELDGKCPQTWQGSAATLMRAVLREASDGRQHWADADADLHRVSRRAA